MDNINKILFITLSNIGDVILSLPVLDFLKEKFPSAKITVLAGPRPKEIFQNNPGIDKVFIYDKRSTLKEKIDLFFMLKRQRFDMLIDLRNSFLGMVIPARYKDPPFVIIPRNIQHMRDRHLYKIENLGLGRKISTVRPSTPLSLPRHSLYISCEDEKYINNILKENNISQNDKIVIISSGARSHTKRWPQEKFLSLSALLIQEFGIKPILVGDSDDLSATRYLAEKSKSQILDLVGKTTLAQLAYLIEKSSLVITNDSAVLHLASYLNVPTVAIFGITNELKYGPWSEISAIVKKDLFCRPCEEAQCKFKTLECIRSIKVLDVFNPAKDILLGIYDSRLRNHRNIFKRILIVRTDRIGDVLLSTPVIKALHDNYPDAHISMMVSPYARDIVEDNPYLDEVVIYDKDAKHKSWYGSMKFALDLRKKRFDLAVMLHPTNRVHLLTFFARIPKRIGYNHKMGFLLTDRIKHTKHRGEQHELEYNLDLVRCLGIEPKSRNLFMPIKPESEKWAEGLLQNAGIKNSDKLLAINPGASCPSKIWPNDRFTEVADKLVEKYGFKVLIVAGPKDISLAQIVIKNMKHPVINLAGRTSVSQLASLLKRCHLFISNDSGPVHIGSAVGVPVISIFGRAQRGLSPRRWGPIGKKNRFLHKDVGCLECLAHNCVKQFACLKAITVADVLAAADAILQA